MRLITRLPLLAALAALAIAATPAADAKAAGPDDAAGTPPPLLLRLEP